MRSISRQPPLRLAMALALVAAALGLAGCPSASRFTRAEPVGRGVLELAVVPGASAVSDGFNLEADGEAYLEDEGALIWFPSVDLAARYGFSDSVDAAVTLRNMGTSIGLDVKLNLARGSAGAISLDPGLTTGWTGEFLTLDLPLLFDVVANSMTTLVFSAQYTALFIFDGGLEHVIGGGFGVEIELAEFIRIQPYLSLMFWLDAPEEYTARFFAAGIAVKLPLGAGR